MYLKGFALSTATVSRNSRKFSKPITKINAGIFRESYNYNKISDEYKDCNCLWFTTANNGELRYNIYGVDYTPH